MVKLYCDRCETEIDYDTSVRISINKYDPRNHARGNVNAEAMESRQDIPQEKALCFKCDKRVGKSLAAIFDNLKVR